MNMRTKVDKHVAPFAGNRRSAVSAGAIIIEAGGTPLKPYGAKAWPARHSS
jgi:hypothetical protein